MRASVLRGLPGLIDRAGGSGDAFLAAHGIEGDAATRNDAFVSARLVDRLLEAAADLFRIPDLGLRMAAQQDPYVLGPLAIAMESSPTIGEALECASRFLFVLSPALTQAVIPDPLDNPAIVGIRHANNLGITSTQFLDYGLGMEHRVVTLLNGGKPYGLRSVQISHPPRASAAAYREHFGAAVAFGCPDAVLRVPRELMSAPASGGNELLRDIAMDYLETHFGHEKVPVSDLVRIILRGNPGPDRPDLAKVSRLLSFQPRSLQRLLASEGILFKDLLDQVRQDEARELILNTDLSFTQIAARIGMREQSSLTHAAQRWFGMPPSRLRKSRSASS